MRSTFTDELDFRQERDFGQKISATFEFIGGHFRPLARVLLYLVVPAALLRSVVAGFGGLLPGGTAVNVSSENGVWAMQRDLYAAYIGQPAAWAGLVLNTIFSTLLILAVYGYVRCCLERSTAPVPAALPGLPPPDITPADVWAVVRRQFVGSYFALWGVSLLVVAGMFLLFVPGLYLAVALSIFFAIKVMENTGFGATLSRSFKLIKGQWWQTFGLLLAVFLILYMLVVALGLAAAAFSGIFTGLLHLDFANSPVLAVAVTSLNSLVQLLMYPVLLILLGFQYFNLVEMNDGVGLERLVNRIGQLPSTVSVRNEMYQADEEGEY